MKPYVCKRCNKAFALKSYLYKHEESSCMKMFRDKPKVDRRKSANPLEIKSERDDDFDDQSLILVGLITNNGKLFYDKECKKKISLI